MAYLQHSERTSKIFSGRGMTVIVVSPLLSKASRERVRAACFNNHGDALKVPAGGA